MDILNSAFSFILNLLGELIVLILTPIDALINSLLPSLSSAFDTINTFVDSFIDYIPYIMSWVGLKTSTITLIVTFVVFKLTIKPVVRLVKLAISWWGAIH